MTGMRLDCTVGLRVGSSSQERTKPLHRLWRRLGSWNTCGPFCINLLQLLGMVSHFLNYYSCHPNTCNFAPKTAEKARSKCLLQSDFPQHRCQNVIDPNRRFFTVATFSCWQATLLSLGAPSLLPHLCHQLQSPCLHGVSLTDSCAVLGILRKAVYQQRI